jgi:hypothetical protein
VFLFNYSHAQQNQYRNSSLNGSNLCGRFSPPLTRQSK